MRDERNLFRDPPTMIRICRTNRRLQDPNYGSGINCYNIRLHIEHIWIYGGSCLHLGHSSQHQDSSFVFAVTTLTACLGTRQLSFALTVLST